MKNHKHEWKKTDAVRYSWPLLYEFRCQCGKTKWVEEKRKLNKYPNIPFVSFRHNDGNKIKIIRTHVKEICEDTKWVHALNGRSYLRTNIVGPIELIFYSWI